MPSTTKRRGRDDFNVWLTREASTAGPVPVARPEEREMSAEKAAELRTSLPPNEVMIADTFMQRAPGECARESLTR